MDLTTRSSTRRVLLTARDWLKVVVLVWLTCPGNQLLGAAEGVTVTVTHPAHPVLIRNEHNALSRIVVDVQGDQPVRLRAMHFSLDRTDALGDLDTLELFASGDRQGFSTGAPFGKP